MKRCLSRSDWSYQIEQWLQSGKSAKAWCRENNLTYTTFLGWYRRLKSCQAAGPQCDNSTSLPSQFIELKEGLQTSSGISLEYENILIHLAADFNPFILKKCLNVLQGKPC